MVKAIWNGTVIAASKHTVRLEGNHYFPANAVKQEFLVASEAQTTCFWKGIARYYDINVGESINKNAAWYYPDPSPRVEMIRGHIAFWRGVEVIDEGEA